VALDTKYRPLTYDDVLGQDASVAVLRQFVKEGRGFHQSYVFCGQHGSGKTTLGRILARALLCESPVEGTPCDQCHSCQVFLNGGTHEGFEELDAASKSGKADLAKIIEDLSYSTFSGRRRIYLFDESHRLSKAALDILLKPMEDCVEGSEDKQLVCIFCTTEPEKMRSTIFSRCAPAFVVRAVDPEGIAGRLAWVCDQEGITYDRDALVTIAEVTECHIRDALKTVEGVSMLGKVDRDSVSRYLQLGANDRALSLLEQIGHDLPKAVEIATQMAMEVSPSSAYERLSEAAMCAYRAHLGVGKVPSYWALDRVEALASRGAALLGIASRFSAPPHRPTRHTLILDVGTAHYALVSNTPPSKAASLVLEVQGVPSETPATAQVSDEGTMPETNRQATGSVPDNEPTAAARTKGGVWIDPRAIGKGPSAVAAEVSASQEGAAKTARHPGTLEPNLFRELVRHHLKEMARGGSGQSR
jgi:DNA polymerase III subunit gamma/tau